MLSEDWRIEASGGLVVNAAQVTPDLSSLNFFLRRDFTNPATYLQQLQKQLPYQIPKSTSRKSRQIIRRSRKN